LPHLHHHGCLRQRCLLTADHPGRKPNRRVDLIQPAAGTTTTARCYPGSWNWCGWASARERGRHHPPRSAPIRTLAGADPGGADWHRYKFDVYGETSSRGRLTRLGRRQYVESAVRRTRRVTTSPNGNRTGAIHAGDLAGAANSGDQIPEQVWGGSTGNGGFTSASRQFRDPADVVDGQYARLAIDIPPATYWTTRRSSTQCVAAGQRPVSGYVQEDGDVNVPDETPTSYFRRHVLLSREPVGVGLGQPDWAAKRDPDDPRSAQWTATVPAAGQTPPCLHVRPGRQPGPTGRTPNCADTSNRRHGRERRQVTTTIANWGGRRCGNSTAVIKSACHQHTQRRHRHLFRQLQVLATQGSPRAEQLVDKHTDDPDRPGPHGPRHHRACVCFVAASSTSSPSARGTPERRPDLRGLANRTFGCQHSQRQYNRQQHGRQMERRGGC